MDEEDISLWPLWKALLGALVGAALYAPAVAVLSGAPPLFVLVYLPFFFVLVIYTTPFTLVIGLLTGATVWHIHLRTGKKVGALLRIGVGVGFSTPAACGLVWLTGGSGADWLMASSFGAVTGASAGLFSDGGDVAGAAGAPA